MLAQLDAVINQVAAQKEAEREAQRANLQQENEGRFVQAWADVKTAMGPLAEILEGMVFHQDHETNKEGVVVAVEWTLGDDAQEIAPLTLRWECSKWGGQGPGIDAEINNGGRSAVKHKGISAETMPQVLYAARQAYVGYKARLDAERQEREEKERQAIAQEIQNLTRYTWAVGWSEADVLARVARLKLLDAGELAEKKLAQWRADVAKEQERLKRREALEAQKAATWAEYEQKLEEWQATCAAWAAQEQERLWLPWVLWKVRYVPFDVSLVHADYDEDSCPELIQEVYTLDDPQYIAQQRAVVSLRRVKGDGTVQAGYAIACFLDAEPIHYDKPVSNHHRSYWAGDHVVNVPPFVTEEPAPAPVRPEAPRRVEIDDDLPF